MEKKTERTCNGCTACCYTHQVKKAGVIVTAGGEWCTHCAQGVGCTIFGQEERPGGCLKYRCYWLKGGGNEADRPDSLGVVIDRQEIPGESPVLFSIREAWPGATYTQEVRQRIAENIPENNIVMYIYPAPGNSGVKKFFPPNFTKEDIEQYEHVVDGLYDAIGRSLKP